MRISEFKQYIKETIVDVLSEASDEEVKNQETINNLKKDELALTQKIKALGEDIADKKTGDPVSVAENEDAEPSKAELQKTKSLAKAKEELAQLTKKMKAKAKDYKSAEGKEKDKIKDELKKMTAEKKKLEKSIQ